MSEFGPSTAEFDPDAQYAKGRQESATAINQQIKELDSSITEDQQSRPENKALLDEYHMLRDNAHADLADAVLPAHMHAKDKHYFANASDNIRRMQEIVSQLK